MLDGEAFTVLPVDIVIGSSSSGSWRRSLDDGPGDGGRLAAGEQPAGGGGGQRHAGDGESEVEDGHVAEVAEVVVVRGREDEVGTGDAEQRTEERERAGGGGGQRAADAGGGSGRGQGSQVTG